METLSGFNNYMNDCKVLPHTNVTDLCFITY